MIRTGDCVELMADMPEASIDAIVTDPPYGLGFMGKRWDALPPGEDVAREMLRVLKPGGHLLAFGGTRTYHRLACAVEDAGFEVRDMIAWLYGAGFPKSLNLDRQRGKTFCGCDSSSQHDLRPMRDSDLSPALLFADQQREVLLPGVQEQGAPGDGALSGEVAADGTQSGVEGRRHVLAQGGQLPGDQVRASASVGAADGAQGRLRHGAPAPDGADGSAAAHAHGVRPPSGPQPAEQHGGESRAVAGQPDAQARGAWPACAGCGKPRIPRGLGTALKPAHEPIVVARKPLTGTVVATVLEHGTGAINVDGCRIEHDGRGVWGNHGQHPENHRTEPGSEGTTMGVGWHSPGSTRHASGRWPANVVLDEAAAAMLDEQTAHLGPTGKWPSDRPANAFGFGHTGQDGLTLRTAAAAGESNGASRFFYCAKASRAERNAGLDGFAAQRSVDDDWVSESRKDSPSGGRPSPQRNHHPTVKPLALMRWLVRLVTPPGGTVLDPFTGSGTTGIACVLEGFDFIGIEREPEYAAIAEARIAHWTPERAAA